MQRSTDCQSYDLLKTYHFHENDTEINLHKSFGISDNAANTFRKSPGGAMSIESRNSPLLPPSSATVTTAVISALWLRKLFQNDRQTSSAAYYDNLRFADTICFHFHERFTVSFRLSLSRCVILTL